MAISYWVVTSLMAALFLFSAIMYLSKTAMVEGFYEALGFPTWMIIPSAVVKILAVIAIATGWSKVLKEWAYAGLFFDAVMATAAHGYAGDGIIGLSFYGIFLVLGSRILWYYRGLESKPNLQ